MTPLQRPRLRLTLLDAALAALVAAAAAAVFFRVRDGLGYRWEWAALPQYLFRADPARGGWVPNVLMQGFFTTLRLSVWATLFAALIGVVMGLLRAGRSRFRRWAAAAYVELTRNTPPLVLVFIFYYFIGEQVLPLVGLEGLVRRQPPAVQALLEAAAAPPGMLTAFASAVATLAIVEGAYITEIVRAGVQSIERGQREAAAALGLTPWQSVRFVVLPQAVRRILPPLGGQFISTIKDSAIVSVISIPELTFRGLELMAATYLTFETWAVVCGMYFVLTFGCSMAFSGLERRSRRGAA